MIEAIAGIGYSAAAGGVQLAPAQSVYTQDTPKVSFGDAMKATAMKQIETVQASEQTTMAAMHGQASLQEVVQATVKAELAVETALAFRNKTIEAYQEIMRMPV
ncbi:MAG: flagellar hook-basal body complex protein FliE [Pseudomonadota bacterium]